MSAVVLAALALLTAAACGDDDAAPGDAARDAPADAPAADAPATTACHVVCTTIMPGEHRTSCVTEAGMPCPGAFAVCDPESVPPAERDRLFLAPQCLADPAGTPPRPFCGLIDEVPAYPDPPVVACRSSAM